MLTTRHSLVLLGLCLGFTACDDSSSGPFDSEQARQLHPPRFDLKNVPQSQFARPPLKAIPRPSQAAVAAMAALSRVSSAKKAALLVNGSFEVNGGEATSLFAGWNVVDIPYDPEGQGWPTTGSWFVQSGDAAPIQGIRTDRPTDGSFAAMTDQTGIGTTILYQDVAVPSRGTPWLSFDLFLLNLAFEEDGGVWFSPNTLSPNGESNQQFRMDIMDPSASIDDVGAGVLRMVFRTEPGDPNLSHYRTIQASLAEFSGRTVRLRFAVVNTREVLEAGIDRVSVGHKLPLFRAPRPRPDKQTTTAKSIRFAPESGPFANVVSLADDETTGLIPIGFEFAFFENRYSSINISSNGFVGFEPDMSHGCCSGFIPSDDGINNLIALAWADLYPPGGGEIAYETRGSAPHRRLVISFTSIGWCCEEAGDRVTSQLILYEQRGIIEIHTQHLENDDGRVYTQGVENADGTIAASLPGRIFAQFGLENDAVRFTTN